MPISSAASFFTPPAFSSARRMVSRSTHSMFWRSISDGSPVACCVAAPSTEDRTCGDRRARRQDHRPLDRVLQLANVAGPVVLLQPGQHAVVDPVDAPAGPMRVLLNEVLDQRRNVVAPLAQRRDLDRDHVEAIEQILLELAVGDICRRSRLVAAITRTSIFSVRSEPSGSTSRSCSTRSQLGLQRPGSSSRSRRGRWCRRQRARTCLSWWSSPP